MADSAEDPMEEEEEEEEEVQEAEEEEEGEEGDNAASSSASALVITHPVSGTPCPADHSAGQVVPGPRQLGEEMETVRGLCLEQQQQQQQQQPQPPPPTPTPPQLLELDPAAEAALDDELLAAAHLGDVGDLEELLRVALVTRGRAPGGLEDTLTTLLFTAANTGRPQTLQVLLKYGADINAQLNIVSDTPLHIAARYDRFALIAPLLQHGAHICARNDTGNTALDIAIAHGRLQFVREFIGEVRERKSELVDDFRYAALTAAAENHQTAALGLLLELFPESVNLNLDEEAGTALHVACETEQTEMIDILHSAGADIEAVTSRVMQTPLMRAAEYGHISVLRRLLELGAELDRQTEEASAALIMACHFGQIEAVKILLDAGANTRQRNRWGFSPLFMGADCPDVVRLLLEHDVDVDELCGERGESAVHLAACSGTTESVRLMLDAGADIDNVTSVNETLVWLAAWKGHYEMARMVIQLNCDLNVSSNGCQVYKWDYTPLEIAIGQQAFPIAKMLLRAGCNLRNPVYFEQTMPGPVQELYWARLRPEVMDVVQNVKEDFWNWFRDFLRNPRTLKDLCKLTTRRCLGRSIAFGKNVRKLPLPKDLKRDLKFSDL